MLKKILLSHRKSILCRLALSGCTSSFTTQHSLINHLDSNIVHHIRNNICRVPMEHGVCMLGMSISIRQLIMFPEVVPNCTLRIPMLRVNSKAVLIPSCDRDLITILNHQSRPSHTTDIAQHFIYLPYTIFAGETTIHPTPISIRYYLNLVNWFFRRGDPTSLSWLPDP